MSKINEWLDKYLFDDDTAIRYLETYLKIRSSQKVAMQRYYQKNKIKLDEKHKIYRQTNPDYRRRIAEKRRDKTSVLLPE